MMQKRFDQPYLLFSAVLGTFRGTSPEGAVPFFFCRVGDIHKILKLADDRLGTVCCGFWVPCLAAAKQYDPDAAETETEEEDHDDEDDRNALDMGLSRPFSEGIDYSGKSSGFESDGMIRYENKAVEVTFVSGGSYGVTEIAGLSDFAPVIRNAVNEPVVNDTPMPYV